MHNTELKVKRENAFIIKGARTHNLKNISLFIPKNRFIVITGVSGSGKSSLAFDTLYAEGHRRYVESLSAYARQFLERIPRPDVDEIINIAPAIAIEQKTISKNARSTVGTITELFDYMRMLYAKIGKTYAFNSDEIVKKHSVLDVMNVITTKPNKSVFFLCIDLDKKTDLPTVLKIVKEKGFSKIVIGKTIYSIEKDEEALTSKLAKNRKDAYVLIDKIKLDDTDDTKDRIAESTETAFKEGDGLLTLLWEEFDDAQIFSERFEHEGVTYIEPTPQLFSFNSPLGACKECEGLGVISGVNEKSMITDDHLTFLQNIQELANHRSIQKEMNALMKSAQKQGLVLQLPYERLSKTEKKLLWEGNVDFEGVEKLFFRLDREYRSDWVFKRMLSRYKSIIHCVECSGKRLRKEALQVKVDGQDIGSLCKMTIDELQTFFKRITLSDYDTKVAKILRLEIEKRLNYLVEVGLGYLTLDRPARTLSGGESQRINLASSLSSSLIGTIYILDEPSIGLHQRDSARLIRILKKLRDIGNTVVVVEHDREIMQAADMIIDIGPRAGVHGGEVVFQGTLAELLQSHTTTSLTKKHLENQNEIPIPSKRKKAKHYLSIKGASENNLKNIDVDIPIGVMTCITGVSGSGKSTLMYDILFAGFNQKKGVPVENIGRFKKITGDEHFNAIEIINQSPIGKTQRSNPVTYTNIFDDIRKVFAETEYAKAKRWPIGVFSFNIPGGRCETCQGEGVIKIEMQFLADVEILCEDCQGSRYKKDTLKALYKGLSISDVLQLTVTEAIEFFVNKESITRKLQVLDDVGLGYMKLGMPGTMLSGGEAQRLKLATHIASSTSENTLFIFDEPTTGLHFEDIKKLLLCFEKLLAKNNTLVIVEHNLDVIKQADWIIDLGPEAGNAGGSIVDAGTPETIAKNPHSYTGKELKKILGN